MARGHGACLDAARGRGACLDAVRGHEEWGGGGATRFILPRPPKSRSPKPRPPEPPPATHLLSRSTQAKTHCDIKLKSFDAKNKIKVIKEVRGVTSLGLKEAKDLVEAAPCVILAKVKVEEATKIIERLKAECGGEFELA